MDIGHASQETHKKMTDDGYEYDPSNNAYYKRNQYGISQKIHVSGNRVCEPGTSLWESYDDWKYYNEKKS